MPSRSLFPLIRQCLQGAQFIDMYKRQCDAPTVRQFFETKVDFPLASADSIVVNRSALHALTSELDSALGVYKSPATGSVGNGLYLLMGAMGSPRLPSVADYAKTLVLAAARIGPNRVAELFYSWIQEYPVLTRSCWLLKGIETENAIDAVKGLRIQTLPPILEPSQSKTNVDDYGFLHDRPENRTVLSLYYETIPGLYDPESFKIGFPPQVPRNLVNSKLKSLFPNRFCQAISLTVNKYVDWFEEWNDHDNVEAFSLQPKFSHIVRVVRSHSTTAINAEDVLSALQIDKLLNRSPKLAIPAARWLRSKRSLAEHEQLIELRIALEGVLLSDDGNKDAEKRHRLSARGAWLLAKTPEERRSYYDVLRFVYDYASTIIHGGRLKPKNGRKIAEDISQAQNLCRDAILLIARSKRKIDWSNLILDVERKDEI